MANWGGLENPGGDRGELEVVREDDDFVLGQLGRLCVLRTRAPLSVAAIDAFYEQLVAVAATTGSKVAAVVIPGARRPGMSDEVRARVKVIWPPLQDQTAVLGIWIRQGSFAGAIQRSIAAALLMVVGRSKPVKVCSKAMELKDFFVERCPELAAESEDWSSALNRFAAAFDPPGVGPVEHG